jgi:hypothetical protein
VVENDKEQVLPARHQLRFRRWQAGMHSTSWLEERGHLQCRLRIAALEGKAMIKDTGNWMLGFGFWVQMPDVEYRINLT